MTVCNPVCTPYQLGWRCGDDSAPLGESEPYAELVGSLLYLSQCTRPDISHAVGVLTRHMSSPKLAHWELAKRILRYLRGTWNFGLCYNSGSYLGGFTDSDFAGDVASSKSTTGCVFELCGAAVSWASKKQTVVATSTCESEYIAACYDAKEGTWLRQMLRELGCGDLLGGATPVGIDNNGALCLIVNGATNARTRHTRVSFHFVRACHASGELEYCSVSTEAQHADFLTKALAAPTFERNVAFVGLTRVV